TIQSALRLQDVFQFNEVTICKGNVDHPNARSPDVFFQILELVSCQAGSDITKPELKARFANDAPAFLRRACRTDRLLERLQRQLCIQVPAKGAVHEHSAERSEFDVSQMLHAHPGGGAKQDYNRALELILRDASDQR